MSALRVVLLASAVVGLSACETLTGRVCTTNIVPAVSVNIVDSLSGGEFPNEAIVRVRDGGYLDSAVVPAPKPGFGFLPVGLARERAGTYQVSVTSIGYRVWTKSDVRSKDEGCHPQQIDLVARLVRAP